MTSANKTSRAWAFDRAAGSNLCVVVLGFNRVGYLRRVLDGLLKNDLANTSTFVVLDGAINMFSGRAVAGTHEIDAAATEIVSHFPRSSSKSPVLHRYTMNVGIAIAWFEIFDAAFAHHPASIFLEDDVVPSPHAIGVLRSLLKRYQPDTSVSGVLGSYASDEVRCTDAHGRRIKQDVAVDRWRLDHNWAFAHWRDRWRRARPTMLEYMALIDGRDYGYKHVTKIMKWHSRIGSTVTVPSQDGAREAAFRAAGYCGMVRTRMRRFLPIGRQGTHFTSSVFNRFHLNDTGTDYIRPADEYAAKHPDRWQECRLSVPASNMLSVQTVIHGKHMTCDEAAKHSVIR